MRKPVRESVRTSVPAVNLPVSRLPFFEERRNAMVETIRQMVEIESPTDNKLSVDRFSRWLAQKFEAMGGHSKFHRTAQFGDHLQVDFPGRDRRKPVLLLGHLDTVYPLGTIANMPAQVRDGRIYGPGSLDMKSGVALMLFAIDSLRDQGGTLPRPVSVLLVSDEEVGSDSSRRITEELAKKCGAVLVLEPSYGLKGAVKTSRKGVGDYTVKVTGLAAHAGLDPGKGQNAILELAAQVQRINKFTDV